MDDKQTKKLVNLFFLSFPTQPPLEQPQALHAARRSTYFPIYAVRFSIIYTPTMHTDAVPVDAQGRAGA